MIFFSLLSIVRINYPTGEINYIPKLESRHIRSFISENPMSVLFFTNNPEECDFANFAITYFSKYIRFAIAPESEGKSFQCKSIPCAIPFLNGKIQNVRPAPHQQTLFSHWCSEILDHTDIEIANAEYLRSILNNNKGFYVIAVDIHERPKYLSSEIPFYHSKSEIFRELNIQNVKKGIYVYNCADHLLNLVENDNIQDLLNSNITPYEDINPDIKKFTAGFNFDASDKADSEHKINLLLNLSRKFNEDFYFTKFDDQILYNCKLQFAKKPLFLVLNNSHSVMTDNWILSGDEALQYDQISNFLTKIKQNSINYSHRSRPDKYSIEIDRFDELLFGSNENDTILIIADEFSPYIEVKTAVESVLSHLNSKTIDFYTLNATINDLPNMINPKKLPSLLIFRGGKNKKENPPIFFHGDFMFQEIVGFLQQTASSKFKVEPFDSHQKDEEIKKIINEQKN